MASDYPSETTAPFHERVLGPFRGYLTLVSDHAEALRGIQLDAVKAGGDIGFKWARCALEVRDPDAVQAYLARQPEMAKAFSERVGNDAEKRTAANQAFVEKARDSTEDSVAAVQRATEHGVQKVQQTASTGQ